MLGERKKIQHLENVESRDLDIFTWILLKISEKKYKQENKHVKTTEKGTTKVKQFQVCIKKWNRLDHYSLGSTSPWKANIISSRPEPTNS